MGVDFRDLVPRRELTLEELVGKSVAVDAYNALYQFLAIIRQPTGELLVDRRGNITSHLSGLLYRNSNLIEKGIRLVYVFDGAPPSQKAVEIHKRQVAKAEAKLHYQEAVKEGNIEEMRMYAQMTSQLSDHMVNDAKRLLSLMGIPWIQAPSEGEAQAAYLTSKGNVWATVSQDYDSLLFGATRLVRNITITGRRKLPRKNVYVEVKPEMIQLEETLSTLGVTRNQLIDIAILIGTDFNPPGIRGVGPKIALKLIKEKNTLENVIEEHPEAVHLHDYLNVRDIFLNPNVTQTCDVQYKQPDVEGVVAFLCGERNFSEERVRHALEKIMGSFKVAPPKTLDTWFST